MTVTQFILVILLGIIGGIVVEVLEWVSWIIKGCPPFDDEDEA